MTKYTLVTDDKLIVKDGVPVNFEDNAFWSNYSTIHAIQIDTNGVSSIENKDGSQGTPTQSDIDAIATRYEKGIEDKIAADQKEVDDFFQTWERVRLDRNIHITSTDKYLLMDFPIDAENRSLIENYRNQLRDLPATYSNEEPKNIVFDENGNVLVNGTKVITRPGV